MHLSRRSLLVGAGSLVVSSALRPHLATAASGQKVLRLQTRQIQVGGKPATRYGVHQASGAFGLILEEGDDINVWLENGLSVPSGLHWHGFDTPWRQDGVPYISGPPIEPGKSVDYKFPAVPAGTRWMHSHFGLQEQDLLAAPLIVRETGAIKSGMQEVVIFLEDFSWTDSQTLFDNLRKPKSGGMGAKSGMDMSKPDLNDVVYDAYLANDRTLADPELIDVERNGEVRLRIINAGASTNFTIDLGAVEGTLVAVDGNPILPLKARQFPLAVAQRADIVLLMPADGSAVPVLARGEGPPLQTGIVLRPPGAAVAKISSEGSEAAPVVGLGQELLLRASQPPPARPVDSSVPVDLTGTMKGYIWGMPVNGMGGVPVTVAKGARVELAMRNVTMMAHPMHLHGHSFQVTEIAGQPLSGAMRDSILVPPKTMVKVIFDANNPGLWAFHCHNLFHMVAGMFATVVYDGFS
ncbi:MAG: multicopper oxidase family protein [Methyloceanibacter sp.]